MPIRRDQDAIQATSGITASTGTEASGPIKAGAPMVDYATGTMGAFAVSAALFQRMRTGQGQYVDLAMLDVAMILQGSQITDYLHSGHHPKRAGNVMRFAASSAFPTKDGLVQLAASNARQHRRFYEAIGDPQEANAEKLAAVAGKMKEKTAGGLHVRPRRTVDRAAAGAGRRAHRRGAGGGRLHGRADRGAAASRRHRLTLRPGRPRSLRPDPGLR